MSLNLERTHGLDPVKQADSPQQAMRADGTSLIAIAFGATLATAAAFVGDTIGAKDQFYTDRAVLSAAATQDGLREIAQPKEGDFFGCLPSDKRGAADAIHRLTDQAGKQINPPDSYGYGPMGYDAAKRPPTITVYTGYSLGGIQTDPKSDLQVCVKGSPRTSAR